MLDISWFAIVVHNSSRIFVTKRGYRLEFIAQNDESHNFCHIRAMVNHISHLLLFIVVSFSILAKSQNLDSADQEALKQTQDLLKNKTQRDQYIKESPAAQQASDFIQQLTGGDQQMSEDIFALAAEVFSVVVKESNGDVAKMNQLLENFKKNPAQFAEKWSPEQKARLKTLADRLEKPGLQPNK